MAINMHIQYFYSLKTDYPLSIILIVLYRRLYNNPIDSI